MPEEDAWNIASTCVLLSTNSFFDAVSAPNWMKYLVSSPLPSVVKTQLPKFPKFPFNPYNFYAVFKGGVLYKTDKKCF